MPFCPRPSSRPTRTILPRGNTYPIYREENAKDFSPSNVLNRTHEVLQRTRVGISGFLIAELDEQGRFRFDEENHAFETAGDEFCQACREQYDRCAVRKCTEEFEAARRKA